ncbi:hypothetical protein SRABI134_03973 [Peribacillus sp. Bi134]|nr:hypothetical protein SRABI134_03973 [Peribacillus sp. Bi134]
MVHRQGEKTESVRWLELLDVLYMFLVTAAGYAFFFLLVR